MKESLESARNIHQFLIVASVVIFIFGLSLGPKENKYDLAIKELKSFREISESVGKVRSKVIKDEFFRNVPPSKLSDVKQKVRFQILSDDVAWDTDLFTIYNDFELAWALIDSIPIQRLTPSAIQQVVDTTLVNPEIFVFGELPVYIKGQMSSDGVPTLRLETITTNQFRHDGSYLKQFLNNALCSSNNPKTFLTKWRSVSRELNGLKYTEIMLELEDRSKDYNTTNKNEANLLGLTVSGDLVFIIGPLIAVALMIYLTSLVSHLNEIYEPKERECLRGFPWLALFRGNRSIWLSQMTIDFIPCSVCCYLVYKANIGNVTTIVYFAIFIPIYVTISAKLLADVQLLRNRITAD